MAGMAAALADVAALLADMAGTARGLASFRA
jgi:hypothetical protein